MSFKDASIVIIETTPTTIKAGRGLYELIAQPTVVRPACVALRKEAPSHPQTPAKIDTPTLAADGPDSTTNGINGVNGDSHSSDDAMGDADVDAVGEEDLQPTTSAPPRATSHYLVGPQIGEAEAAGETLEYYWPFATGDISDWPQAEAIWKRLLFTDFGVRRKVNESPVCLSFTPSLSHDTYERITQLFFERFNVPALCLVERPLAQLCAVNATTGIVVEVGRDSTTIIPVLDTILQHHGTWTTPVGARDCEMYLAYLLSSSQSIAQTLSPPEAPLSPTELWAQLVDVVQLLIKDGHIKSPVDGEVQLEEDDENETLTDVAAALVAGKERALVEAAAKRKAAGNKANAAAEQREKQERDIIAALDLVTVTYRDKQVTVGKERHRLTEPLFDPAVLHVAGLIEKAGWSEEEMEDKRLGIQEAVQEGMAKLEYEKRRSLWEAILVVGELSQVKGVAQALQSRLRVYTGNDESSDVGAAIQTRVLKIPEYFAEYRDKGEGMSGFLGASIVAKVAFGDPAGKNYVSKVDYNAKGPTAVLSLSPSLF